MSIEFRAAIDEHLTGEIGRIRSPPGQLATTASWTAGRDRRPRVVLRIRELREIQALIAEGDSASESRKSTSCFSRISIVNPCVTIGRARVRLWQAQRPPRSQDVLDLSQRGGKAVDLLNFDQEIIDELGERPRDRQETSNIVFRRSSVKVISREFPPAPEPGCNRCRESGSLRYPADRRDSREANGRKVVIKLELRRHAAPTT